MLTGTKKRDHITRLLASLHWLSVHFRIQFKTSQIAFSALNGQVPSYITDLIHWQSAPRSLRFNNKSLSYVPKLNGVRAFAAAAPRLWNQLQLDFRCAPSICVFYPLIFQCVVMFINSVFCECE